MKNTEYKNMITKRVAGLSMLILEDMAKKLTNDLRTTTDLIFEATLNELEKRLPEKEFVKLMELL